MEDSTRFKPPPPLFFPEVTPTLPSFSFFRLPSRTDPTNYQAPGFSRPMKSSSEAIGKQILAANRRGLYGSPIGKSISGLLVDAQSAGGGDDLRLRGLLLTRVPGGSRSALSWLSDRAFEAVRGRSNAAPGSPQSVASGAAALRSQ